LGSTIFGIPTVARGKAAITSFYGNKIITTGEGGAIFTNDGDLAKECRLIINHYMRFPYEHYSPYGYNYAPNEMAAAVGLAQLGRIQSFLDAREMLAERYFKRLGWMMLHDKVPDEIKLNWWAMPVMFGSSLEKEMVSLHLRSCGIETRPIFTPLNVMAHFAGDCPQAEHIWLRSLLLPMHTSLTLGDVDYVCEEVYRGLES
jgi:perosamine synthetase